MVNIAELHGVIGDRDGGVAQPFDAVGKQLEIAEVIMLEEIVFVFLQLL